MKAAAEILEQADARFCQVEGEVGVSRARLAEFLFSTFRWIVVGALVYAPWAYGCTTAWTKNSLTLALVVASASWIGGLILQRQAIPAVLAVTSFALLGAGWGITLFSGHSVWEMLHVTGLLGCIVGVSHAARDRRWRDRFVLTIGAASASVAAFGILQKLGGESVLAWVWEAGKRDIANNFGMFRYRANAGAFLNLGLAVACCGAIAAWRKGSSPGMKTAWATILSLLILGAALNPSRASWALGLGIIGAIVLLAVLRHGVNTGRHFWAYTSLLFLAVAIGLGSISFGKWQTGWTRLQTGDLALGERCPYPILWTAAKDAGWLGFGAGQFHKVFPEYQKNFVPGEEGAPSFWMTRYWPHAHQDYLQTIIEWGWGGAALWAIFCLTSFWSALGAIRARHSVTTNWVLTGAMLGIGATLVHSFVDFPLQIASIQLYIAVLVGFCWSPVTTRTNESRTEQSNK